MPMNDMPNVWRVINQPISYLEEPFVYLETADRRLFSEPYGPRFPKAVGKVFCLEPIYGGEHTEVKISHVRIVTPWVFDDRVGDRMRIRVLGEGPLLYRGEQFAIAMIISSPDGMVRSDGGTRILLTLYSNLTEEIKRALLIQSIIESMLSIEHAFNDRTTQDERDTLDAEQQTINQKVSWTNMSIEELELHCQRLTGNLPY